MAIKTANFTVRRLLNINWLQQILRGDYICSQEYIQFPVLIEYKEVVTQFVTTGKCTPDSQIGHRSELGFIRKTKVRLSNSLKVASEFHQRC